MKGGPLSAKLNVLATALAATLCAAFLCACGGVFDEQSKAFLEDYGSVASVSGYAFSRAVSVGVGGGGTTSARTATSP